MVKLVVTLILIGVLALRLSNYTQNLAKYENGVKIGVTGTILNTPEAEKDQQSVNIANIKVIFPAKIKLTIGDRILASGNLNVQLINNETKVLSLNTETLNVIGSERSLRVTIAKTRNIVLEFLQKWLPGNPGGLAAGILVGGNEKLTTSANLAFQRAGLTHILAASGYNVTVVAGWTEWLLLKFFNRFIVNYIGIFSIILYVFLAGGSAAVVRAGLMVVINKMGKIFGRESEGGWLLLITGLGMLIWEPAWLWDVGFQLSITAMLGIIYFAGKSVLSQTLACQLTTLPLIIHYFGNLSLAAPFANLLFLWPVQILMPVLALVTSVGIFIPAGGMLLKILAAPLLWYMLTGINWLSSAHWASVTINNLSWGGVFIYYLLLFLIKRLFLTTDNR